MLGKLFGAPKKREPHQQTRLTPAQAAAVISVVGPRSIPAITGAAADAFRIATDPNAEARDFIRIVEADEALAGRVVRMANSAFYSRGAQNSSVEEAIATIGLTELRNLLGASALVDVFPSNSPERAIFWEHDMAVAIIARALAREIAPAQADAAFLAGLMHDVGKLLLLQQAPEAYARVLALVRGEGLPFHQAEEQIFPFSHIEVGLLIADKWNFPESVRTAIAEHHKLAAPSADVPALVALSNLLAHAAGLSGSRPSQIQAAISILSDNWPTIGLPNRAVTDLITFSQAVVSQERGHFP